MKIVLIGAVASGAACAARLRRLDEKAEIVIVERGEHVSYANCGLPYRVGNVITNKDALLVMTPEGMKQRFNADVRTWTEAGAIDPTKKTVQLRNLKTGEVHDESYDKLVVATGSKPIRPAIPGIESDRIHTLWSVPDAEKVKELVSAASDVAVIGGGFVGIETAENLVHAGKRVTLIEAAPQVMTPLDTEMAEILHAHLRDMGVNLILADGVKSFDDDGKQLLITLKSGNSVAVQQAVLSIGVRPNSELLKNAGIACNERGYVIVNEHMETSSPDIYAAGDIVQIQDTIFNEPTNVPLAGPAAKQGRIIADRLGGVDTEYHGAQGTSIIKVFELSAASTGANEKKLIARGLQKHVDYETIIIQANSHVGFYPGAEAMTMKLLFACDGSKIYGAQIVGRDGVDKRIDVLSTVIRLGGTTQTLETLDLAYAPPFGAAKDPINMLGFVAQNVVHGLVKFAEVQGDLGGENTILLDVREDAERMAFAIPEAVGIPLGTLRDRLNELDRSQSIIVFCGVGVRAYNAARILMQNGFDDVRVYPGGVTLYKVFHSEQTMSEQTTESVTPVVNEQTTANSSTSNIIEVDCCGMQCPGPLIRVFDSVKSAQTGDNIRVTATDPGFLRDAEAWCRRTGNTFVSKDAADGRYTAVIQKGSAAPAATNAIQKAAEDKTIIVFSGDFDKVMASFIIANGAAAMGRNVTMFFTFWGLTALRKIDKVPVKKSFMEKMFGFMLPKGVNKLGLSRMNMGGLGTIMMKKIMNDKNVNTLEDLVKKAMANGVHIMACSMSMDVMGIHPEELIDGVEVVGVGTYLANAEESNVNLFI